MKRFIVIATLVLVLLIAFTSCKSIGEEIKTINDIVVEDTNPTESTSQH